MKMDLKQEIDNELSEMTVSDELKNKIYKDSCESQERRKIYSTWKTAAAVMAVICLTTTTAFAGYNLYNRLLVNQETLPELDAMKVIDMPPLDAEYGSDGWIEKDYNNYKKLKNELGVPLLDTKLAVDNPYMHSHITTDNKDYAGITVENYILGDTGNYRYDEEEKRYIYDQGSEYLSPVSLTVSMALSREQLEHEWDTEYLGYYQFAESYTSSQGFKVNILEDTVEESPEDYVSEKSAVFVADGIEYIVKGRTSLENIKGIVDSME